MVSREKKIALSNAMHQCNLYRQYTRSQVYHEPRFHVLLSTKAAQSDVGYMYHGIKMKALPIDVVPEVASYATELARVYKLPQNQWDIGVDLILYKDGDDSIGWHADDTQGKYNRQPYRFQLYIDIYLMLFLNRNTSKANQLFCVSLSMLLGTLDQYMFGRTSDLSN